MNFSNKKSVNGDFFLTERNFISVFHLYRPTAQPNVHTLIRINNETVIQTPNSDSERKNKCLHVT